MDFNQFQQFKNIETQDSDFNQVALVGSTNKTNKNKILFWLVWFLLVAFLAISLSFGVALFQEVSKRNQEINNIKQSLQKDRATSLIDESLLNQIKEQMEEETNNEADSTQVNETTLSKERVIAEKKDRPTFGNPNASLVIVAFIDFECPFCQDAFPALRTIMNRYEKEVYFIFRNYPVLGDNSTMLAQASMCAHEQGKFLNLHDRLMVSQGQITSSEILQSLLIASGIEMTSFSQCLREEKYGNIIKEDIYDALDLGVTGTPTFFINGSRLPGVVTLEVWEQIFKKHQQLKR